MRSGVKGGILTEFLTDNDWMAVGGWASRGELKPNELRILVGFKPSPYFAKTPEWEKLEKIARQHRRMPPIPKNKPIAQTARRGCPFPQKPK
jgi:hypothetical protein